MGLFHRLFRGIKTAGGGILTGDIAPVTGLGDLVNIGARRIHRGVHIGDLALHQLEASNRLAELLALGEIGHDFIQTGGHDAGANARKHHTLVIQPRHEHAHAAPLFAKDVLERRFDIVKDQLGGVAAAHAKLVEMRACAEAFHALLDQKGGDALAACIRIGLGVNHQSVGIRAVGDPVFAAVELEVIVALFRPKLHRHHIASRARL